MAKIVSPLITNNKVLLKAVGYVAGNIGTYNGISVIVTGPDGPQSTTVFKSTGAQGSFFTDLAMVQMHVLYSQDGGGQSVGAGSSIINPSGGGMQDGAVTYDQSIFNYIQDFYAANG
jgi:hypothetical protein